MPYLDARWSTFLTYIRQRLLNLTLSRPILLPFFPALPILNGHVQRYPHNAQFNCTITSLLHAHLAPSSRQAYGVALRCFNHFCLVFKYCAMPSDSHVIRNFLAYLYQKGLSCATARVYFSAVVTHRLLNGYSDPVPDKRFLEFMFSGWMRIRGQPIRKRDGITLDKLTFLLRYISSLPVPPHTIAMFRAALCLSFYGFLRVSEFCAPKQAAVSSSTLLRSDIVFF